MGSSMTEWIAYTPYSGPSRFRRGANFVDTASSVPESHTRSMGANFYRKRLMGNLVIDVGLEKGASRSHCIE